MNDRIIRALRREPVDCTPVWFMRQAGRSLPRYRELRQGRDMFDILRDPPAAAEITALPLQYFPVDAAILYNDLSTPFLAAGLQVEMRRGIGPVVDRPIRAAADVDRLRPFDPREALEFCLEQIRILTERLDVPVLGFVGAPFTLCTYLVPGPRARRIDALKAFLWREPQAWRSLADFWTEHLAEFAVAQVEAGAAAVQVFDSWAGALSPEDYEEYLLPHSAKLFARLRSAGVLSIHFATGNPALLPLLARAGGDAVGVDWRQPLDVAWDAIGPERAIQGNLDPVALLAGTERATAAAREILRRAAGRPGHIFNLGHGLLPETEPPVVRAVVECVHEHSTGTAETGGHAA